MALPPTDTMDEDTLAHSFLREAMQSAVSQQGFDEISQRHSDLLKELKLLKGHIRRKGELFRKFSMQIRKEFDSWLRNIAQLEEAAKDNIESLDLFSRVGGYDFESPHNIEQRQTLKKVVESGWVHAETEEHLCGKLGDGTKEGAQPCWRPFKHRGKCVEAGVFLTLDEYLTHIKSVRGVKLSSSVEKDVRELEEEEEEEEEESSASDTESLTVAAKRKAEAAAAAIQKRRRRPRNL
jgi:hypothetical protein